MKKFLAGFCAAAIAAGCMGMTVMAGHGSNGQAHLL